MTKRIEIKHRRDSSKILGTAEVEDVDPQPVRTALERLAISGRSGSELRDLRADTVEAIEGADDTARQQLQWRLESIDRELASPSARANLDGAYLDRANLAGAYLARANLDRANLARAYLDGANLAGANLDGAYLDGANLAGAYLARANLAGANLAGANLDRANLDGAYLAGANLAGAYLARANLDRAKNLPAGLQHVDPPEPYTLPPKTLAAQAERARRYRDAHPEVPVVEQLDAKILARVEADPACFSMREWHCGTTHCRAGQAIDIAGKAGYELERKLGDSARAGAMIYMASVGFVPWFYDQSNEHALADIRRCAAEQTAAGK